ncbi:MAG TPA: hypothetical protein VID28_02455 [Methylomirabilota bacterium]|jgi:hypothetical protein
MGHNLVANVVVAGLVLVFAGTAAAQTLSALPDTSLRPSWSDSAMAGGWRSVCGDVWNTGPTEARGVAIRVQGLDGQGQVVSTRDRYVSADVPTGSRAVFCVPMPAGAASYVVTVVRADWGSSVQGP